MRSLNSYLGMFRVYYMAPVDLIAVLYVGRFAVLSWEKDAFMGQNSSNTAGIDDQFSRHLGFNFCYVRKKERYPREKSKYHQ
jgi:hypothetical protein